MEALEKAKLALRKYLLENRDKVVADLDTMRKMSEGNDIFRYVENMSEAFSIELVNSSTEIIIDFSFQQIDCCNLFNDLKDVSFYPPPIQGKIKGTKKDSEIFSEFFFVNLENDRNTKSIIFV
jgi:hypothetical protein